MNGQRGQGQASGSRPGEVGAATLLSDADVLGTAAHLYAEGPALMRRLQQWRPRICPFAELLALVPAHSRVLDVGCGSGLFLGLLAALRGLRSGIGFDASRKAIGLAVQMQRRLPAGLRDLLRFEYRDVRDEWPPGVFDVVSLVDVMHHVPPPAQQQVLAACAARLQPGGLLLYKDMAGRPAGHALANRLHDLILARQWIHYVPLAQVHDWAAQAGLVCEQQGSRRMGWYAHEWLLFRRPGQGLFTTASW